MSELTAGAAIFYDRGIDHEERLRLLEARLEGSLDDSAHPELRQYRADTQQMLDSGHTGWSNEEASAAGRDAAVAAAVERAAATVRPRADRPSFLEKLLDDALLAAWPLSAPAGVRKSLVSLPVPGWEPQPGQTDLALGLLGEPVPTMLAELKVDDIGEVLWDLLKLVSIAEHRPEIERTYLVVAARPRQWRDAEAAALFALPTDDLRADHEWNTRDMLARWKWSWEKLLGGGRARPRDVPARVRTTFVAAAPVPGFGDYEVRCIGIEAVEQRRRVRFADNGWPGSEAERRPGHWRLEDLILARGEADRWSSAHPDLRDFHALRYGALSTVFGVRLAASPPRGDPGLETLLGRVLEELEGLGTPFDDFLEAPPVVAELHTRHKRGLDEAIGALRTRLVNLAVETVAALWGVDAQTEISDQELKVAGFDPAARGPDPTDYL